MRNLCARISQFRVGSVESALCLTPLMKLPACPVIRLQIPVVFVAQDLASLKCKSALIFLLRYLQVQ